LTNDAGTVTDAIRYLAFGDVAQRTGTTDIPFQYVGQKEYYRDEEIGSYSVRERPVSPTNGRWLAADPALHLDSLDLYSYVRACPTRLTDPSGMFSIEFHGNIVGHSPRTSDIDPTETRITGARWRFVWNRDDDGNVFAQRVVDFGSLLVFVKPCKCPGSSLPASEEEICDAHSVHWRERFGELWPRPTLGFARDNHTAGPTKPAKYLEEQIGKKFIREGTRLFLGRCPGSYEVTSWTFSLKGSVDLVNGTYSRRTFVGGHELTTANEFVMSSLTVCDEQIAPPPTSKTFDSMLYWGPTTPAAPNTWPDTRSRTFTANDEWREFWQTGMDKPVRTYDTTGYPGEVDKSPRK
jgi:RHS repeat-associated protein